MAVKRRKVELLKRRILRLGEQKKAQVGRGVTPEQLVAYLSALVDVSSAIKKVYGK